MTKSNVEDNTNTNCSRESMNNQALQTIYRVLEKTKDCDHRASSDRRMVSSVSISSEIPETSSIRFPRIRNPPKLSLLNEVKSWKHTKNGMKVQSHTVPTLPKLETRDRIKQRFANRSDIQSLYEKPLNQVDFITDNLILTGYGGLFMENFENLPNPIQTILNITFEVPLYKPSHWDAYRIPVSDTEKDSLCEFFIEIAQLIQWNAQNNKTTIVHCMAGVSRSATCVMAYLIMCMGFTLEQAFILTRNKRSVVRPKLNFLKQLAEFEKIHIKDSEKRSPWIPHTKNGQTISFPKFIVEQFMEDYEHYFEEEE